MNKNKKVLHVVNISFVINYFFGNQFKYLSKKTNNDYYVACSPSKELYDLSMEYEYIPFELSVTRSINLIEDLKSIVKLYQFIKKNKINVVIGHTPKGGMIAMIACYFAKVEQKIYFRHGIVYETSSGLKRYLLKTIDRISGSLADKVVCVSNDVKRISEKDKLNNYKKNIVLGLGTCNGVDCYNKFNPFLIDNVSKESLKNDLGINDNDFVVGFLGRLVNDKGIPELLAAWRILLTQNLNIKMLLVGPFESKDGISTENKQYIQNEDSIIHTGLIDNSAPYLNCMDLLVLPTYREGFPTVVLEASSMQIPVLITRATGCEESIIDGVTGYFINHDPDNIVDKINLYIKNIELQTKHGQNGRNFVKQNFDQKIIWDHIHTQLKY